MTDVETTPASRWFAPTHHDYLVKNHGLDPAVVPLVDCACGIKNRRADYMVDVTGLPDAVREALGISGVDYLCDGCRTRLFRLQHITQADFNSLLGAPEANVAMVREHDAHHQRGIAAASPGHRPLHKPLAITILQAAGSKGSTGLARQAGARASVTVAALAEGEARPVLPLKTRTLSHADSVTKLQRQGVLASTEPAPITPAKSAMANTAPGA